MVWKSRSLRLKNGAILPVQYLQIFAIIRLLTSYSKDKRKQEAKYWTLSQKVKGQPSNDFLGALIFWQDIWTHLGQFFFLLCTQMHDDERKMSRKFYDKLSLIKVSEGRCPKSLDDFSDFSILCQVGRFTYAFCYQFLMIFLFSVNFFLLFLFCLMSRWAPRSTPLYAAAASDLYNRQFKTINNKHTGYYYHVG